MITITITFEAFVGLLCIIALCLVVLLLHVFHFEKRFAVAVTFSILFWGGVLITILSPFDLTNTSQIASNSAGSVDRAVVCGLDWKEVLSLSLSNPLVQCLCSAIPLIYCIMWKMLKHRRGKNDK